MYVIFCIKCFECSYRAEKHYVRTTTKSMRFWLGYTGMCISGHVKGKTFVIFHSLLTVYFHIITHCTYLPTWPHSFANWWHTVRILLLFDRCLNTSKSLWRWRLTECGHRPTQSNHFKGHKSSQVHCTGSQFYSCCGLHLLFCPVWICITLSKQKVARYIKNVTLLETEKLQIGS